MSISEFNEMTPYELRIYAEVFAEKQQFETEEKITLVWMAENFRRTEELPPLEKILGKEEEKKEMSADDMLLKVMQLNSAFGGTVQKVGEE